MQLIFCFADWTEEGNVSTRRQISERAGMSSATLDDCCASELSAPSAAWPPGPPEHGEAQGRAHGPADFKRTAALSSVARHAPQPSAVAERISGQREGYYVATYACPVGEFGEEYVGYGRLFRTRPDSFWDAFPAVEVVVPVSSPSVDQAHRAALALALGELPSSRAARGRPGRPR
jgi:hypothetical protein